MKEIEKRLVEHSIKLPGGGTLREDVIIKHGVKIGWKEALDWVRVRITENLKFVSRDDNIACVKNTEHDIEVELGICQKVELGDGNGYRKVCDTCGARLECRAATNKQIEDYDEAETG